MDLGLDGRRALVLGSSSGLGRAVAATLIAEGALVAVVSRDRERSAAAAAELGAHAALVIDLVEPGAGDAVVADAVDTLGGLDIVVVNTGGGTPGPILSTAGHDDAAYHSMLRPVLEISRAAAQHVTAGGAGRMVYLTSRAVVEATPELALELGLPQRRRRGRPVARHRARAASHRQRGGDRSVRHARSGTLRGRTRPTRGPQHR